MANKEEDYDENERESSPRVSLFTNSQPLPRNSSISFKNFDKLRGIPVLPYLLQFSPNEGVESAEGRDGNE